jgi:hypothetical protein
MQPKPALLVALLAVLLAAALVRRNAAPNALSEASLAALLACPLDSAGPRDEGSRAPFWQALLEHPAVTRTATGVTLRLGRVLSDPSAARLAAESAGELLALEAEGPQGKLGVPLWRAVLDGPSTQKSAHGRTLALNGCRHSADADAGPALEDTYSARLALGSALGELALSEPGAGALTLLGQKMPVKGGVNFEIQLLGDVQSVVVTFDGRPAPSLKATRTFHAQAPNDARARANFVAALRARLEAEGLGKLTVEGETSPVADGLDVRIEEYGGRVALVATRGGGGRLATHRELAGASPAIADSAPGAGSGAQP